MASEILERYRFTQHARQRIRQRGIRTGALAELLGKGVLYSAGGGSSALWLGRRQRPKRESPADLALIITEENEVITVMHCRRVPRHWKRIA